MFWNPRIQYALQKNSREFTSTKLRRKRKTVRHISAFQLKVSNEMDPVEIIEKSVRPPSSESPLRKIYRMSLLSAGSISLDSTFKLNLSIVADLWNFGMDPDPRIYTSD